MRQILAALLLTLGLASPALAAVCSPTPALPDTERRTEYTGIVAQTGPFNVGFQLYGDNTDYANWVDVWVSGVKKTAVTDYTVTSPSGPLANLCRPISDAQVTFVAAQTGTIEIVGARRPRRASQFSENAGVPARSINQVLSDMEAQLRERWDWESRVLRSPPGETLSVLPPAATRAGKFLFFDATGLIPQFTTGSAGSGNVVGPATSTVGNVPTWNNTTGTLLANSGIPLSTVGNVFGPPSSAVNNLAVWNNTTGTLLADGGPALLTPNIRPSGETSYTIAATDSYVVNRNITALTNWSLGPNIGSRLAGLTLRNDSNRYPVIVTLTGGATVNDNFTSIALDPLQGTTLTWDGTQYRGSMSLSGRNSALGQVLNMVGYGAAVGPLQATLSGSVTVGNVVGFDYTFNPGAGNITISPRHTMVGGDTLLTAWQDVFNQICASVPFQNWIGRDLWTFSCPAGFILTTPAIGWDQLYPNVTSTLTAFTSGGATATVTIGGQGNLNLDATSYIVGGVSPKVLGRNPVAGDALFQIYIVGDNTTGVAPVLQANPVYGLMSWSITDATAGAIKGDLQIQTDTNTVLGRLGIGTRPTVNFEIMGAAVGNATQQSSSFAGATFYNARRSEGAPGAPTAAGAGQIANLSINGFNGSTYTNSGAFVGRATQTYSGSQSGSNWGWFVTPNGTNNIVEAMRLDQDGLLKLGALGNPWTTIPNPLAGSLLQLVGPASSAAGMEIISYASGGSFFYGRRIDGTPASPAALTSQGTIAAFDAQGYNGSATIETGALSFANTQTWSVGATGSRASLFTTANGTSSLVERQRWDQDGSILIPASVTGAGCGAGCVNAAGLRVNNVAVLTGNQSITLSGDVTGSGATAITTALANIPTAVTMAGYIDAAQIGAPANPAAGKTRVYAGTSGNIVAQLNSGAISVTATPISAASTKFLTALNNAGTFTQTQPAFTDISGTATVAQGGTGDTGTAWTTYTPTITANTGTFTSVSATGRYKTIGKTVFFEISITDTTNGTAAGFVKATLPPVTPAAQYAVSGFELVTGKLISGFIATSATNVNIFFYDGTYPGATGNQLVISGVFEST